MKVEQHDGTGDGQVRQLHSALFSLLEQCQAFESVA
jgi:hypothetical protein